MAGLIEGWDAELADWGWQYGFWWFVGTIVASGLIGGFVTSLVMS